MARRLLAAGAGFAIAIAGTGLTACGQSGTAAGGCWYVPAKSGNLAVHLPQCDGPEANVQRDVMVNTLNLIPGNEPSSAREICQVKIGGNDPTAWIGVWANSASTTALGGAQSLCQLSANSGSGIRWSNFH